MIETLPNDAVKIACQRAWNISGLTFVRKMENIVYACQRDGHKAFLRLTTPLRRSKSQIQAELHFMTHLHDAGITLPFIIPNDAGESITTLRDGTQHFEAVLFSAIEGEHPSNEQLKTPEFLIALGSLIGTMHNVSEQYEPLSVREHWYEERGVRHALEGAHRSSNKRMRARLSELIEAIHRLPITPQHYGLIHADLGATNLFLSPSNSIAVIDFDDSCYHFHVFDFAIVIYSMAFRFNHAKPHEDALQWLDWLVKGYRTQRHLSDEQIAWVPMLMDFARLRLYFWIEYHQHLNTFHDDALERILCQKQWALNWFS